jgi:hypothetical protein
MKTLILYSTICGGFFAQTEGLGVAIRAARDHVGDDVWKRGYSGSEPHGATVAANHYLHLAGIKPIQLDGAMVHVGYVENRDSSGNTYPKLRLGLQNLDDQYLLSVDLKSDVAQRLVVKLDNCTPGEYIRVSAWPTFVQRDGRKFVNHAASMKNANGTEVPANSGFSAQVKTKTDAVDSALKAVGVFDKKVIATAKVNKRVEAHKDLLLQIQTRFAPSTQAAHA